MLINHRVHPVKQLRIAPPLEDTTSRRRRFEQLNHLPQFGQAKFRDGTGKVSVRRPAFGGGADKFRHALIFAACDLRPNKIIAVRLVDDYRVGKLHNSFFYALQIVARAREHNQHKEVDHRTDGCFRLPDANRFNQNHVVARRFAHQHSFAAFTRHAAQCSAGGAWTNKRFTAAA